MKMFSMLQITLYMFTIVFFLLPLSWDVGSDSIWNMTWEHGYLSSAFLLSTGINTAILPSQILEGIPWLCWQKPWHLPSFRHINNCLLSYSILGTFLDYSNLSLFNNLWGSYFYYLHFTGEHWGLEEILLKVRPKWAAETELEPDSWAAGVTF